ARAGISHASRLDGRIVLERRSFDSRTPFRVYRVPVDPLGGNPPVQNCSSRNGLIIHESRSGRHRCHAGRSAALGGDGDSPKERVERLRFVAEGPLPRSACASVTVEDSYRVSAGFEFKLKLDIAVYHSTCIPPAD